MSARDDRREFAEEEERAFRGRRHFPGRAAYTALEGSWSAVVVYVDAAGCPNCCRHCCTSGGRPPHGGHYSLAELRELREGWGPLVVYHEASAHPEYPEVMGRDIWGSEGSFHSTNGFGIARAEDPDAQLGKLRDLGWTWLSLTLHGLRENHDWFVGREGAFSDIINASDRALRGGIGVHWNLFIDNRNLGDVRGVAELGGERGITPHLQIATHHVSRKSVRHEALRPSLTEVLNGLPASLLDEVSHGFPEDLEEWTERAWVRKWREAEELEGFRYFGEPREWPPGEELVLDITRGREVWHNPYRAPPVRVGRLEEGRDVLVERSGAMPEPPERLEPPTERSAFEGSELLHSTGASFRGKVISGRLWRG